MWIGAATAAGLFFKIEDWAEEEEAEVVENWVFFTEGEDEEEFSAFVDLLMVAALKSK